MTIPRAAYQTPAQQRAAAAIERFGCPFCGAAPAGACQVRGAGTPLKFPHLRRINLYDSHFPPKDRQPDRLRQAEVTDSAAPAVRCPSNEVVDKLLSVVRPEAIYRVCELMERITPDDLTALEVLAIVAVLESADQRVNAPTAPVLQLIPT
jgi:hypothetical protein